RQTKGTKTAETSSQYLNCRIQCRLWVYILGSMAMSGLVIVHRPCKLKLYSTHGRGIPLNKTSMLVWVSIFPSGMSLLETGYGFPVLAKLIGISMVCIK